MSSNMPIKTQNSYTIEQGFSNFERNDRINIFIVGDSHIVRSGLRRILDNEPTIHVLGEVSCKQANVELISDQSPDLLLLDLDSRAADVLGFLGALHGPSE